MPFSKGTRTGINLKKTSSYAAIKLSCLPKHFEETQLREYFSQFGTVHGVYLPRSKKTLNTKGIAFVLVDKEIAPLVSSTMHNVLNFNKIMKCKVLDAYYPSWFNLTPPTISSVDKEKRRRASHALKPSKAASRRRIKGLRRRVAALQEIVPQFSLTVKPTTP